MAFGETAGGVEAAVQQADAVEALDESSSSDNGELDPKQKKVMRKSRNRKKRKPRVGLVGRLEKSQWMPLSHLRKLPSALKQETDRLRGDKNDQVLPDCLLWF